MLLLSSFIITYHIASNLKYSLIPPIPIDPLIYPRNFPEGATNIKVDGAIVRAAKSNNVLIQQKQKYSNHAFNTFNSRGNGTSLRVQISKARSFQTELGPIIAEIAEKVEFGTDMYAEYLRLFLPFHLEDIKKQLRLGTFSRHWFRFSGSSVWLQEYGVHFMSSRFVYSQSGHRNSPAFSLMYGQVFDKDWNELKLCKLVVPTNDLNHKNMGKSRKSQKYTTLSWPNFIPIPFFHEFDHSDGRFLGPEDGHLSLMINKAGHEEPVMVFNSKHIKYFKASKKGTITKYPRSMYMAFPFQFQYGKHNMYGRNEENHSTNLYNKAVEFVIPDFPARYKAKNWVPFINYDERKENGYDKHLYLIYRWADLEILKCDLDGICRFVYRRDHDIRIDDDVGDLRGGTQMVNINEILEKGLIDRKIPKGRQIWAGFPRSHLVDCGCGTVMYRPHFAVLVLDSENYRLSHITSSIGFDVPVTGWDLTDPMFVCEGGGNVLTSNGISMWNVLRNEHGDIEDYLTLMLSIGDFDVHSVDIKGVLGQILNMEELFEEKQRGYNDINLLSAMERSVEYCGGYKGEFEKLVRKNGEAMGVFIDEMMIPPIFDIW